jgi:uncharacterized membrane protein YbhN (UPF0104 family)
MRSRRHPLLILLGSAVLEAAAAILLVWLIGGWGKFSRELHFRNIPWFALCLGAEAVAYLGYMLAFREIVVVEGGPRIRAASVAAIVSAGFSPVFMADVWGGFSVDRAALEELGLGRSEAVARVLAMNGLEYALLAPAACISALLLLFGVGGSAPRSLTLPWLLVIPGLVAAGLISRKRPRVLLPGAWRPLRQAIAQLTRGLALLRAMIAQPRKHALGFIGAGLYWAGDITVLWTTLHVFDIALPLPALILAFATGYALTRRALPAGGPGAVEALLPLTLRSVHAPFAPSIVAVFTYRFFNFWLALIPGVIVLSRLQEVQDALSEVANEGPEPSNNRPG